MYSNMVSTQTHFFFILMAKGNERDRRIQYRNQVLHLRQREVCRFYISGVTPLLLTRHLSLSLWYPWVSWHILLSLAYHCSLAGLAGASAIPSPMHQNLAGNKTEVSFSTIKRLLDLTRILLTRCFVFPAVPSDQPWLYESEFGKGFSTFVLFQL